jgi:hypothetical protein
VFPGCRMPATTCDIDHHTPWSQGGPTHTTKLDPLLDFPRFSGHLASGAFRAPREEKRACTVSTRVPPQGRGVGPGGG